MRPVFDHFSSHAAWSRSQSPGSPSKTEVWPECNSAHFRENEVTLVSEARIALADPAALAARLIAYFVEYDVVCETRGGRTVADLGRGTGMLSVSAHHLTVRVEAPDQGDLELLRSVFASHVVEFAPTPPSISWSGLDPANATFAGFREIRLIAVADLNPHLRRLTFSGRDLGRFSSSADLHVRLYIPPPNLAVPEWPRPGRDGRTLWPQASRRPAARYYTLRYIDEATGRFDIDFVLHEDAGPGADFAARCQPGDLIGMDGPFGRNAGTASWHLLAGDETALPAIARILEEAPFEAEGLAIIEVAGREEELPLAAPPGYNIRWLHRNGAQPGLPDRLLPALRDCALPRHQDVFVWIGCEHSLAKSLRRHVTKERGISRDRQLIVGYWTRDDA